MKSLIILLLLTLSSCTIKVTVEDKKDDRKSYQKQTQFGVPYCASKFNAASYNDIDSSYSSIEMYHGISNSDEKDLIVFVGPAFNEKLRFPVKKSPYSLSNPIMFNKIYSTGTTIQIDSICVFNPEGKKTICDTITVIIDSLTALKGVL